VQKPDGNASDRPQSASDELRDIFVVEDDLSMSQILERLLKAAGWFRTRLAILESAVRNPGPDLRLWLSR
jgi:hypothetical protein